MIRVPSFGCRDSGFGVRDKNLVQAVDGTVRRETLGLRVQQRLRGVLDCRAVHRLPGDAARNQLYLRILVCW